MLKKSLVFVAVTFLFNASLMATNDISGDEDRKIPNRGLFSLTQIDEERLTIVDIHSYTDRYTNRPYLDIGMKRNGNITLQAYHLILDTKALSKMGLKSDKHSIPDEMISSVMVRERLLQTPLKELLTDYYLEKLYSKIFERVQSSLFKLEHPPKISITDLKEKLPPHLPLQAFLVDPALLFTEADPSLRKMSVFQGSYGDIEVFFDYDQGSDTFSFGLKVKPKKGDYISFSLDSRCVLQDEEIAYKLSNYTEEKKASFIATLLEKRMKDLLGTGGHKRFISSLSSKGFKKKKADGSGALDYSGFTSDLTLKNFCNLVDNMMGTAELVTWATSTEQ